MYHFRYHAESIVFLSSIDNSELNDVMVKCLLSYRYQSETMQPVLVYFEPWQGYKLNPKKLNCFKTQLAEITLTVDLSEHMNCTNWLQRVLPHFQSYIVG